MTTPNSQTQLSPLYDINTCFNPSSSSNPPKPHHLQPNPNTSNSISPPLPHPPPLPSASYTPPVAPGPYSYPPQQPPPSPAAVPYHQYQYHPHQMPNYTHPNNHNRPAPFPAPALQQQPQHPVSGPNPGVRLMATLSAPPANLDLPPMQPHVAPVHSQSAEFSVPSMGMELTVNPAAMVQPGVMRMPSSKLPKGR